MSDATYIGNRARSIKASPEFAGISKVVLVVSDDLEYTSGTGTGRTITVKSPWGTQKIADDILTQLRGFRYQPYTATGARIDPAAELGDGVTVGGIYSGIYTATVNFGTDYIASLSAPLDEELEHEYPYVSKQERQIQRQYANIRSTFKVQAEQIAARVEKTGGDNKSFGWNLTEESWILSSESKDILVADRSGLRIEGEIRATSGKIGGFDIMADYLSYNGQTWQGTNSYGAYLGTSGLQLGKSFRVDMMGNLYAASGTFEGTIYAKNISYGGSSGTLNGSAITSSSIGKSILTSGVRTSLGHADYSNKVFSGQVRASFVKATTLSGTTIILGGKYDDGATLKATQISYTDGSGNVKVMNVVTWS